MYAGWLIFNLIFDNYYSITDLIELQEYAWPGALVIIVVFRGAGAKRVYGHVARLALGRGLTIVAVDSVLAALRCLTVLPVNCTIKPISEAAYSS